MLVFAELANYLAILAQEKLLVYHVIEHQSKIYSLITIRISAMIFALLELYPLFLQVSVLSAQVHAKLAQMVSQTNVTLALMDIIILKIVYALKNAPEHI